MESIPDMACYQKMPIREAGDGRGALLLLVLPMTIIEKMGDKVEARRVMQEASVPVVPGSDWRSRYH